MKKDVKCPNCGKWQEIDHDDGSGYEEYVTYHQECGECGYMYSYKTSITYSYEATKCPCQNGGEHDLEPVHRYPPEFGVGRSRCKNCDEEIITDKKANEEAIKKYSRRFE